MVWHSLWFLQCFIVAFVGLIIAQNALPTTTNELTDHYQGLIECSKAIDFKSSLMNWMTYEAKSRQHALEMLSSVTAVEDVNEAKINYTKTRFEESSYSLAFWLEITRIDIDFEHYTDLVYLCFNLYARFLREINKERGYSAVDWYCAYLNETCML
jgi:hypothetical protein